jgi:hypothetical protein
MSRLIVQFLSGTLIALKRAAKRVLGSAGSAAQFAVLAAGIFMPQLAVSQDFGTASNSITVSVQPITVLLVSATILDFNFSSANAVAGQDQMILTDQTSVLTWGTNSSTLNKITVSTDLASPKYLLQLEAVNLTAGGSTGIVTLSTTPTTLVTTIARSMGSCSLLYTVTALASQGMGTDSHTITFSITS